MKNKDIELSINYFGLKEPIRLAFWELVTMCVSLGIIIAALGDFITQLKWVRERRRMIKTDREHQGEVNRLNTKMSDLESENQRLQKDLEQKNSRISELEHSTTEIPSGATASSSSES
jgi:predicted RNase H-like nuclease (RuvC/YqgF family)